MIIARITDGLGNQMFQYAAARRLALRHDTSLKLDDCTRLSGVGRSFGLHQFCTSYEKARWKDLARLCPIEMLRRLLGQRLPKRIDEFWARRLTSMGLASPYRPRTHSWKPELHRPLIIGNVVSERHSHFDPDVLVAPDNVCLAGYWQDQRYFSEITAVLRRDFELKSPPVAADGEIIPRIRSSNSVSLHVRRGDKVSNPHYTPTKLEYCLAAMAHCRTHLHNPLFFIFGDDWEWIHRHLPEAPGLVHVHHPGPEGDATDLHLMSLCRHHIIAASSFSWWAAWLNRHAERLVVTPPAREWTSHPNFDTSGLLPSDWTVLEP